jgi:hypothetical protein
MPQQPLTPFLENKKYITIPNMSSVPSPFMRSSLFFRKHSQAAQRQAGSVSVAIEFRVVQLQKSLRKPASVALDRLAAGRLVEPFQIPSPQAFFLRPGSSSGLQAAFGLLLELLHAGLGTKIIFPTMVVGYKFWVGIFHLYSANGIHGCALVFRFDPVFTAMHGIPPSERPAFFIVLYHNVTATFVPIQPRFSQPIEIKYKNFSASPWPDSHWGFFYPAAAAPVIFYTVIDRRYGPDESKLPSRSHLGERVID